MNRFRQVKAIVFDMDGTLFDTERISTGGWIAAGNGLGNPMPMSLINSFKIFREVYLLTGDYPYDKLYTLQHFMNNKFSHLDYSQLSTGAVIMSVAMIVIVGILFIVESKLDSGTEE